MRERVCDWKLVTTGTAARVWSIYYTAWIEKFTSPAFVRGPPGFLTDHLNITLDG